MEERSADATRPTSQGRRPRYVPDIEIVGPEGPIPLSRLAPERKLKRIDRYQRRAEVTARETLTSTGTVRISFRVVDDEPFEFSPGYFVGIQAEVSGFGTRRSPYCITSLPNAERTFQLIVRLVPEGPLSYYLASLKLGDVIAFRGPSGRSMIPKEGDDSELVLLATGVGIGPFVPLVTHLLCHGFDRPIRLFWGLRLIEDVCLVDELDELERRHPTFSYDISLSQPNQKWQGLRGRLTETMPPGIETLGRKRFYLVGNGKMIEEIAAVLSDLGVNRDFIYEEVYFNARYRPEERVLTEIRNRFIASDLFSPFAHQAAHLFLPERRTSPHHVGR